MKITAFIIGVLLIIPGAFMIVDSILSVLGKNAIFFTGIPYKFEFVVGYALVILGTSNIDQKF